MPAPTAWDDYRTHVFLIVSDHIGTPVNNFSSARRVRLREHADHDYTDGHTVKQCADRWIAQTARRI